MARGETARAAIARQRPLAKDRGARSRGSSLVRIRAPLAGARARAVDVHGAHRVGMPVAGNVSLHALEEDVVRGYADLVLILGAAIEAPRAGPTAPPVARTMRAMLERVGLGANVDPRSSPDTTPATCLDVPRIGAHRRPIRMEVGPAKPAKRVTHRARAAHVGKAASAIPIAAMARTPWPVSYAKAATITASAQKKSE